MKTIIVAMKLTRVTDRKYRYDVTEAALKAGAPNVNLYVDKTADWTPPPRNIGVHMVPEVVIS